MSEEELHDELTELFIGELELDELDAGGANGTGAWHDAAAPEASAVGVAEVEEDLPLPQPFVWPARAPGFAEAEAVQAPGVAGADVVVEALALAHLPVRGSLWVREYASRQAEREGGLVALVRSRSGRASVEMVGPGADAERSRVGGAGDRPLDLGGAVRLARSVASRLIVSADEPTLLESIVSGVVDRVTVLTSADDASVVGAYRLLKALAGDRGPLEEAEAEGDEVAIGLAVVGADEASARMARRRLWAACERFIGRPLEDLGVVEQVRSRSAAEIGADLPGGAVELIRALDEARDGALDEGGEDEAGAGRDEGAGVVATVGAFGASARREPAPAGVVEPKSAPASVGVAEGSTDRPGLAPLLGLRPAGVACPVDAGVELGVDREGSLCLIAWLDGSGVAGLSAADAWAKQNAALLAKCVGGLHQAAPVLHIATERATAARGLLDTGHRAHLVRRVEVEGRKAWVADPLN